MAAISQPVSDLNTGGSRDANESLGNLRGEGEGLLGRSDRELRSLFFALSFPPSFVFRSVLSLPIAVLLLSLFFLPFSFSARAPTRESPRGYSIRSGGFEKEDWSCPGGRLLPPSCSRNPVIVATISQPSDSDLSSLRAREMPRIKLFSGAKGHAMPSSAVCLARRRSIDRIAEVS